MLAGPKPKVITLCGSTRFKSQFEEANKMLTLQGNIVLSLAFFEKSEGISVTDEQVELFGRLHFHKINMSDGIYVINPGGYIGESTQREIEFAHLMGKEIVYLEN